MKPENLDRYRNKLLNKLDWPCRIEDCENKPERVRFHANPPWGFDPDTKLPLSEEGEFLTEVEWLLDGAEDASLKIEEIRVYCLPHFEAVTPSTKRATSEQPDYSVEPSDDKTPHVSQLRELAFEAYGRTCVDCGETDRFELQVRLSKDKPQDLWAREGAQGFSAKYKLLYTLSYPPGFCVIRCDSCVGKNLARTSDANARLRARVIDAYGGECAKCARGGELWLVRRSGTSQLRYPGSGRRVSSKDKYRQLAAQGFPRTHELLCRACWKQTKSGGSVGDPT